MKQYKGTNIIIKYNIIKNYINLKLKNTNELNNFI
jgi:hypothetical protein